MPVVGVNLSDNVYNEVIKRAKLQNPFKPNKSGTIEGLLCLSFLDPTCEDIVIHYMNKHNSDRIATLNLLIKAGDSYLSNIK